MSMKNTLVEKNWKMCYSGESSERGNYMEQLIYGTTKYKQLKKESLSENKAKKLFLQVGDIAILYYK